MEIIIEERPGFSNRRADPSGSSLPCDGKDRFPRRSQIGPTQKHARSFGPGLRRTRWPPGGPGRMVLFDIPASG